LSDGQGIWQQNVSEPTGRAIISGQHIYAPTRDGLLAFRANTGQAVESDAAHIKTPLGNLLAWNGALYSVGLFEVRKFPDLERGYSQALASYKQQPQDPSRALRLAWLERLKGRPQNALDVLSTLDESLATENPSRYAEVNHLRVQLLLALAKNLKAHEPGRLDYLQDAACLAQTEHDRLETAFALGNHHQMAGSPLRACEQYLSLLVSPLGDRLMQMDENLEQRARLVAEKRIRNSLHRLDEEQRGTFRKKLNNLLADASAEKRKKILNNLAQCTSLADITGRAALQVGIHAVNQWQYEKAEYFFHRILEHAINKRLKAEALARLAAIYLLPGQLHLPLSAVTQLDRLKKNYPDIQLPARVIQTAQLPDPGNDPESQGTEEAVTIAASGLVKQLRHKIDQQKLAYHRTAQQPVSLGPPKPEKAVFEVYPNARPLLIRNNESEALIDSFLLLTLEEQVKAYSRREGQLRWSADLELPGELAVESRTDDMIRRRGSISRPIEHIASGLADGQTLIVNTAEGLHAVGLTTGRRLWAVPFVPPQPAKRPKDPSGYDAWMWIHNGLLVSIDSRGRLEAAPSYAGKQVRWRKELDPLDPWYIVRCRNDHVVVLDATMNKVQIIRLSDGVTMGHGKFKQPFPLEPISLSIYDEIIVGPISEKEIAACELSAPGVQRWRLSMPGLLSQMFKPAEDLLGVSDDDGHIKIVEPASGEVSFEGVVPACRDGGVTGGLLKDGLLYVWGYQHREVERTRRNRIRWAIAVIELESGLIVWQKRDLPPDTYLQPKIFKDSSNAVPLVTMQRKDQQPIVFPAEVRNRYPELSQAPDLRGAVRLTVLDKRTGEPIGESVALPIPRQSAADRILNVDIYPGFIGVEAGAARFHFPVGQLQQEQGDAKGQKTKQTADTNKE
jgi:outer membrane protein assembly factor BamB